jgi:hypothetical protein
MALKLYRRHRKECEGGHPEDSRSGEFEEARRGWKRCSCIIHASGTIGDKFNRKQTGKSSSACTRHARRSTLRPRFAGRASCITAWHKARLPIIGTSGRAFHTDRLIASGECHVRTTKTGRKVYTWIPEWLQERIREREQKHKPLIFGTHLTRDMNVITDVWRRKLNRLWSLCGPWKEKPTPHRFRHTFARILLQKPGVTVREVAELLGDTEEMIRKHYGAWVPDPQGIHPHWRGRSKSKPYFVANPDLRSCPQPLTYPT